MHATGRGPDPIALEVLTELGLVANGRPSRRLDRDDIEQADLILGLALHHVRDVVVLDRAAFARTFAMAELVARADEATGVRRGGEGLQPWLARLHESRTTGDLLVPESPFDITDPTGGPRAGYLETAKRIDGLARAVTDALYPPTETTSAPKPRLIVRATTASLVEVVVDGGSAASVRAVERQLGQVGSSHLVDGWQQAGELAQSLTGRSGTVVLCLTTEPHGAAMVANRNPSARAVVVTNAGMVNRTRRRLDANVACVPSGLRPDVLARIAEALASTVPADRRTDS